MKTIQRGNRQIRVDDVRADQLIKAAGYVEIDKDGNPIIYETAAQQAEKALKEEIKALRKENKELKAQLAQLAEEKK